jgi:hypothetical protein
LSSSKSVLLHPPIPRGSARKLSYKLG